MKKLLLILLCLPMIGFASFPIEDNITLRDTCDNIILKDGKEIFTKVIEIDIKHIKYKDCNNLEGPLITILKKDVVMIRYNNGHNEIITTSSSASTPPNKKVWTPLKVIGAILLGILGFLAIMFLVTLLSGGFND